MSELAATSTNCPGCSAHIDLRDYKIVTSFSRSIRTRGDVFLAVKAILQQALPGVVCRSALLIEAGSCGGKSSAMRAKRSRSIYAGKIPGRLAAKQIIVEKKSDVQCSAGSR